MRTMTALICGAAFALCVLAPPQSEAARGPATPPPSSSNVKKCAKDEIWSKVKKKCIKTSFDVIPDEDLLGQAQVLALSGEYEWAITLLSAIRNQDNPEVLKFIGYSHRKAGRIQTGIGYYYRALAIDPDDVTVREYLGEGYVSEGRVDLARGQLQEIALRCGESCTEYLDLAETIKDATSTSQ